MSHLEKMMNEMEHPVGDLLDWSNDEKDMGIACHITDRAETSLEEEFTALGYSMIRALTEPYEEEMPANLMEITKAVAAKKITKEQAYDCFMTLLYAEFEAGVRDEIDHYNEA